jgi:phage virion morphogenesis protein
MAGANITITLQNAAARRTLAMLVLRGTKMKPVFQSITAALLSSTPQRFQDQRDPEGNPWVPLAPSTILARLGGVGRIKTKKGFARKNAAARIGNLKILIDRGLLLASLTTRADDDGGQVGTNKIQAALMQLGGTPDMANAGARAVPARPYLGVSADDEREIAQLLTTYFEAAA